MLMIICFKEANGSLLLEDRINNSLSCMFMTGEVHKMASGSTVTVFFICENLLGYTLVISTYLYIHCILMLLSCEQVGEIIMVPQNCKSDSQGLWYMLQAFIVFIKQIKKDYFTHF
jgi:hypothetical protein